MANPGAAAREGTAPNEHIALMLGGGGARGAYQAGVLRGIARRHPGLNLDILTGISAGAVNTIFLAAHPGPCPRPATRWSDSGSG